MSEQLYSVALEVQKEIFRVFEEHPDAIEAIGGQQVFQETLGSVYVADEKFEERGEFLLREGETSRETADEFSRLHVKDYRDHGRPSLPTMAMEFAEDIGLERNSVEYKAMIMMATRAEVENKALPEYHSKEHYADVTAIMGAILKKNNEMAKTSEDGAVAYSPQEQALGFIAALGHDLDHPGGKNPKDDPLMFENKSIKRMMPFLEEAGLDEDSISKIKTIITVTSPDGPHGIIKEVARAHRAGDAVDWEKVDSKNTFPQLRELEHDRQLTQLAASLSDADLYASGAAGIETNIAMSKLFTAEERRVMGADVDYTTDKGRMGFFEHVIGEDGFTSIAGRAIANEVFMAMRAQTAANIEAAKEFEASAEETFEDHTVKFCDPGPEPNEFYDAEGRDLEFSDPGGVEPM